MALRRTGLALSRTGLAFRRAGLPLLLLAVACKGLITDSEEGALEGFLALDVRVSADPYLAPAESGRVRIEGPTNRTVTISPGTTDTISGLAPGTYSVALEGLAGGEVVSFGERTGVTVTAGNNTSVTVTLHSFTPQLQSLPSSIEVGGNLEVRFSAVVGAQIYLVEVDDNPDFSSPQTTESTSTTVSLPMTWTGTTYVRVRARNRFGAVGEPCAAAVVTVIGQPVIGVSPASLSFSGEEGDTNPDDQTLVITNDGSGSLEWSISDDATWLTLNPVQGTNDESVTVSVNTSGLPADVYTGGIVVSGNAENSPLTVPVTLTVESPAVADLSLTKVATDDGTPTVGENVTYTLTVDNLGPDDATGVVVVDTLPAGVSYVSNTGGASYEGVNGVVTWTLGALAAADAPATLDIVVTLDLAGAQENVAVVSGNEEDPADGNNLATATTNPGVIADLQVEKAGPTSAELGETIQYGVEVVNLGPHPAENVVLLDSLSMGVAFVSASGGATLTGLELRWSLGTLEPEESFSATVTVTVDATGTLTNILHATSDTQDPTTSNNRATVTTQAITNTIRVSPSSFNFSGEESGPDPPDQTLTISNDGEATLNWSVTDDATWLTLSPPSGTDGGSVTVSASTAGLAANTYNGTITVTGNAENSPVTVPVTLTVGQSLHTLTVAKSGQGTVTSDPTGINCGSDCSETYPAGTPVTLTATPSGGYTFTGWSGACTGTGTCQVTMDGARSVSATFEEVDIQALDVSFTAAEGIGGYGELYLEWWRAYGPDAARFRVYASSDATLDGGDYFLRDVDLDLSWAPRYGSEWVGGPGFNFPTAMPPGDYYAIMVADPDDEIEESNESNNVVAASTPVSLAYLYRDVDVTVVTPAGGSVGSSPSGIDCGGDCVEAFRIGETVTLTAVPNSGWAVGDWGGACAGTSGDECGLPIEWVAGFEATPIEVTVDFEELPPTVDTLYSVADASVASPYPNTNLGLPNPSFEALSERLAVGPDANTWAPDPVGFALNRGFLIFDLSTIPAGASVSSAVLRLRASGKVNSSDNRGLGIFTVSGSWSETGITWNNQPSVIEALGSPLVSFGHGDCWTCELNVTSRVSDWHQGTVPNFGFSISSPFDADTYQDWTIGFYSRHASTATNRPMLIVTYQGG